jgi:CBS domain-containing protein
MSKLVRDAMTSNPRTALQDDTVLAAARILEQEDVGSLPVVDADGVLSGMLTDRDIAIRVVAAGKDPATTKVDEVASKHIGCVYPEDDLDEALDLMAYRRVRRLPVVEDDRVVGILAQADVVLEVKDKKAGHLLEEISQPVQE